jgi:hypothetical protein
MAATKIKDLCVVVARYEKDGKVKNVYENIGHIMKLDDGSEMMHLKASAVPFALRDEKYATVVVSRFDVTERGAAPSAPVTSDVPF